jgi:prophage regulatory protein
MQQTTQRIVRIKQIKDQTGLPASTVYDQIRRQLFTKPVKFGERISGWPASEVNAIVAARISGQTDEQIKELVKKLHAKRQSMEVA